MMNVPFYAAKDADAWARWTMETFGLTAGTAAIEIGKELLEDVEDGRSTLPVIAIDGERIN